MKIQAKSIFKYTLGGLIAGFFFATIVFLMIVIIPGDNKEMMYTLVGILGAKFSDVVSFYFGSSQGSSDKTAIIANGHKPK